MLDEPTRGMDGLRKLALAELLRGLAAEGTASPSSRTMWTSRPSALIA